MTEMSADEEMLREISLSSVVEHQHPWGGTPQILVRMEADLWQRLEDRVMPATPPPPEPGTLNCGHPVYGKVWRGPDGDRVFCETCSAVKLMVS